MFYVKSSEPSKLATLLGHPYHPLHTHTHLPMPPAEMTRWLPCPPGIYQGAVDLNSGPHIASLWPPPPRAVSSPFSKRVSKIGCMLSISMRSCGRFQARLEPALLPASELPVVPMAACGFHGTGDVDTEVHVTVCSMLHL